MLIVEISHEKQASLASIDSGISGGNKSPEESVRIAKKRAPLPPKLKAKQISNNGGIKLPAGWLKVFIGKNVISQDKFSDKAQIQEGLRRLSSKKISDESNRPTGVAQTPQESDFRSAASTTTNDRFTFRNGTDKYLNTRFFR